MNNHFFAVSMETEITENVAKHSVVQVMACTLKEYDYVGLKKLYEAFHLRVTPIENNARIWLEQQVVKGEQPRRYGYYRISINPERWADVIRTVKPKDLDELLDSCMDESLAMHGEAFEERLKQIQWPILEKKQPLVTLILESMVQRTDFLPFTRHLPCSMLSKMFFFQHVYKWKELKPVTDFELIRQLFLENPLIEEQQRNMMRDAYLYNVEFLRTGNLAGILEKMTPGEEYHCLPCRNYMKAMLAKPSHCSSHCSRRQATTHLKKRSPTLPMAWL